MRLRDVRHTDVFDGKRGDPTPYDFTNNRFMVFNRDGIMLNSCQLEEMQRSGIDVLGVRALQVLEARCYEGPMGDGITHIRLDVDGELGGTKLIFSDSWRFGDPFGDPANG